MTTDENTRGPKDNQILASLPADEYERLLPQLEEVELKLADVLYRPDEPIQYVYFPHRGSISVAAVFEDGAQVEVSVVGNEGMLGMPVVLGTDSAPFLAIVQVADGASRMRADALKEELSRGGGLQYLLLRYGQAFFTQAAQNAACNRRHHVDGRLARWLLMCQDRAKSDDLELTHEFLSTMLGVRRAGVTVAAAKLEEQGLITNTRARIHILNRAGLEKFSCECYHIIQREFDRLLTFQVSRRSNSPTGEFS